MGGINNSTFMQMIVFRTAKTKTATDHFETKCDYNENCCFRVATATTDFNCTSRLTTAKTANRKGILTIHLRLDKRYQTLSLFIVTLTLYHSSQ